MNLNFIKSNKGIILPILGLTSILIGSIIINLPLGLNVHSGEIFIWLLIPFVLCIFLPLILFVKSLKIVKAEDGNARKHSFFLTYALGGVLLCILILLAWISLGGAS